MELGLNYSQRLELRLNLPGRGIDIALLTKLNPRELALAARRLREKGNSAGPENAPRKKRFFITRESVAELKRLVESQNVEGPFYRVELAPEGAKVIANFEEPPAEVKEPPAETTAASPAPLPATEKALLRRIDWLLTFYKNLLDEVIRTQRPYFNHFDPHSLAPLDLVGLAEKLKVSHSTVQRATKSIGHITYGGRPIPLDSLVPSVHLQTFQAFYFLRYMEGSGHLPELSGADFARDFGGIAKRTANKYLHEYKDPRHPVHRWLLP